MNFGCLRKAPIGGVTCTETRDRYGKVRASETADEQEKTHFSHSSKLTHPLRGTLAL